jgi:hypothetical protein
LQVFRISIVMVTSKHDGSVMATALQPFSANTTAGAQVVAMAESEKFGRSS